MSSFRQTRAALHSALIALALLTPAALHAQFTQETAIVSNGVRFFVRPEVSITTTAQGVVQVTLQGIRARIDEMQGVTVDGRRHAYNSFNRGLVSYFNAIEVQTLSLGITFDNVAGCSGRVGYATWRVGGTETLSCNSGSNARITGYSLNSITTSGVLELQSEVRRLLAEERRVAEERARQARADSIARAEQQRAALQTKQRAQSTTRTATSTATSTAIAGSTASATASSTPMTAEQQRAQQEAAAAEARRQQARQEADAAARAAEAAEVQRQQQAAALDAAADQFATAVVGMAQAISDNRRMTREREERQRAAEAARVARYRAAALARYAEASAAPRCASLPERERPRVTFGNPVRGTLSMQSCRAADETNAAVYQVRVPDRTWVKFEVLAPGFNGFAVLTAANGTTYISTGLTEFWLPAGEYGLAVYSRIRGEIGSYDIRLERAPRSVSGDWLWGVGVEQFSGIPFELYDGGATVIAGRLGLRPHNRVELFTEAGASLALLTGELGARVFLQNNLGRSRFFLHGAGGYYQADQAESISYLRASGTGVTVGLGWEFTVSTPGSGTPGTLELAVLNTRADLTGEYDAPFEGTRLRVMMNLHRFF